MGKQIRCTSRLSLDEVRQIPGVLSAKADRNAFELHVNAAEPVVRELLQRDSWLADLEVTNAGLEEAFLALTQNHKPRSEGELTWPRRRFPLPVMTATPLVQAHARCPRERSQVRAAEEYAHPGIRDFDGRVPADVLCAVRHRVGQAADRADNATYMLATMGCFGVMAVALFGFGVSLAMERGQGWLQVKRASPMPVSAYFLAKLFAAVVFSTVIMLLLLAVGIPFGGVRLPLATAAKLVGILVAGSIPFSAMGLAIGYFAKPNSAPAVVNLIYLPMSFCSGLWIPLFMLPHGLQSSRSFCRRIT